MKIGTRAGYNALDGMSLNMFTNDELFEIHCATLNVLFETGIRVLDAEAQEIFSGGGCTVNKETNMVKIPPHLVEEAIQSAPSSILLGGIDSKEDYLLQAGKTIAFTNFGEAIELIDPVTKKRHGTTKKDVGEVTRMCTAMDQIDFLERPVGADDVPGQVQEVHNAEAIFNNTTKHSFIGSGNGHNCGKILQMAYAIAGGQEEFMKKPIYSATICPNSPLRLNPDITEVIITASRGGAPCLFIDMGLAGATSPVTLAGALVVQNAELLSSIVLAQLVRKGHPVIYGTSSLAMDLRTTTSPVGSPSLALFSAATAKMAQYYLLPSWAAGG